MTISDVSLERSGSEPSTSKAVSCVMLFVDWLWGSQRADVACELSSVGNEMLVNSGNRNSFRC
jgi:hypothetical protein